MKVIVSSNRNPHFITITEYVENALRKECELTFFDNRDFIIPGRFREALPFLQKTELVRLNRKMLSLVDKVKPDVFLGLGGQRTLSWAVEEIKNKGVKTVLWTIDPPKDYRDSIFDTARYYDFIFAGGSEVFDYFKKQDLKNIYFLPFACDPDIHTPQVLTENERLSYSSDIAFVGTIDFAIYPYRVKALEALSDLKLSIWGPGSNMLPKDSPLKNLIRGQETPPDLWAKIYSAAKIVLCVHYRGMTDYFPCYQASPRVYEALACGAFVIVDAQKDVLGLFKNRKHLVVFENIGELRDIVKYYLERPLERKQIAEAGRREVIEKHTYSHRIKEMFSIIK